MTSTTADWSRVRKLEPGTEITVMIGGSQDKDTKGHFVSADDVSVTTTGVSGFVQKAARTDVLEIRREPNWARRHPGPTGALLGAVAGVALLTVSLSKQQYTTREFRGLLYLGATGYGAGLGAATGAVIGAFTHSKREEVIYRTP